MDRVRKDLKHIRVDKSNWFRVAQDRGHGKDACNEGLRTCTDMRQRKQGLKDVGVFMLLLALCHLPCSC